MYIGILGRKNNNKITFNKEIINIIHKYNATPIGLIFDKSFDKNLINLCDGIILQGGNNYEKYELEIIKYLHKKNIPTLGICLGMQMMGICFNGKLNTIKNHNSKKNYVHSIKIYKNSKLYQILKKDKIYVNSRHKSYIEKTNLQISSKFNIIESIEDSSKDFFIGVQWHPESLMDKNSILLFNNFFFSIKSKKN